jgi:GR25 family glycosyltransferase involved in LPS biosynthesis
LKKLPIYVISLDEDTARRDHLLGRLQMAGETDVTVIRALLGRTLCDAAYSVLTQDIHRQLGKGTLGCFLSHVSAWERVAASENEAAIVLEDDVTFSSFEPLNFVNLPPGLDILFISDRMSLREPDLFPLAVRPTIRLLEFLDSTHAMGGDGYVLTRSGAHKLLRACEHDYFFGHVDGRLLRYITTEDDLRALPPNSWIGEVIKTHHSQARPPGMGVLTGGCLSRPIVQQRSASSSRDREDAASR